MTTYDLVITAGGLLKDLETSIIQSVSGAIGLIPGYRYENTWVQEQGDKSVITVRYEDLSGEPQAVVIPAIVYAILIALTVMGIVYITYELVVVNKPVGYAVLGIGAVIAVAYLITAIKRK